MNVVFIIPSFIFVSLCTGVAVSYLWEKQFGNHIDILREQFMTDRERIVDLERQLAEMTAACEAAKAEVPPLDRWRVLSTAIDIAYDMFEKSDARSEREAICDIANTSMKLIFKHVDRPFDESYRVNWKILD